MDESTLLNILTMHKGWLNGKEEGKRADLIGADLSGANLRGADLSWANLREANLSGANLSGANLSWANLRGANLREANLSGANLSGANLSWANLRGANLIEANLRGAKIEKANFNYTTAGIHEAPQGELTVWGKKSGRILQFTVTKDTPRSCATSRKHRSENVITASIDDGALDELVHVTRYGTVTYKVGEVTHCDKWDADRWNECSGGIHWFLTRKEAEEWNG